MNYKQAIIITDPIYIFKGEDWKNFIQNPEQFPRIVGLDTFQFSLVNITNLNDPKINFHINKQKFSIDNKSNMICVVEAQELFRFIPQFDYHVFEPWSTVLIDFSNELSLKNGKFN